MIKAIRKQGGAAPLSTIQNYVARSWGKLRKRDGTKYIYDYRRVIAASLANTSSTSPLFEVRTFTTLDFPLFAKCGLFNSALQKHATRPGWWTLGSRAKNLPVDAVHIALHSLQLLMPHLGWRNYHQ
jgi:hypothetical protein